MLTEEAMHFKVGFKAQYGKQVLGRIGRTNNGTLIHVEQNQIKTKVSCTASVSKKAQGMGFTSKTEKIVGPIWDKCIVKWYDTKKCDVVPSDTVEEVELESQRPKRKGLVTALRSEADTFSAENELEIRYKGEKVTDLSQAYLLVSGKMKMCDFPDIEPALCLAFDLYNAKLVDSYKSEQKNRCKMAAAIAKRKIEAISVDMKKTFSAESAEKWLKEKNKKSKGKNGSQRRSKSPVEGSYYNFP